MKNIIALLGFALTLMGNSFAVAQPSEIFGTWKTEQPLWADPRVYSSGLLTFTPDSLWFQATCVYTNGPVVESEVQSPVDYSFNQFYILSNSRSENGPTGQTCVANLTQGPVEFQIYGHNRMVIFSRATNWRLDLVRQ